MSTHLTVEAELHAEADRLLDEGLHDVLASYGEVHVIGSYMLGLMTWRDLDIHVVRDPLDRPAFFALGAQIAHLLMPRRMHYRDETVEQTPGLPAGLYWGVYLGDERQGAWKIDVWATDPPGFHAPRAFGDRVRDLLTPASRETILQIKSACWQHPDYRRSFSSADIYDAVLEHGIETTEQFWKWLRTSRA